MWTRLRLWLTSLVRRTSFEDELADEVAFHIHARSEEWERQGAAPAEARRRARLEFGSVEKVKAEVRDVRRGAWVEHVGQDLRYGQRMLRKHPGFTVVAVLSLAIGIGANSAIFSLVNAFLLQETAFDRPEELVNLYGATPTSPYSTMSYPDFEEIRDGTGDVFRGIGVSIFVLARVEREDGARAVMGEAVSGGYFPLLGLEASLGRVIGPSDDVAPGAQPVVMLGYGYWQRAFGGDPDIVGRELRLGGRAYTVVGIAPEAYRGALRGIQAELFVPISMYDELMGVPMLDERDNHNLIGVARLAPGATLVQAETAVAAVTASLDSARLDGWRVGDSFSLVPTTDVLVFPSMDPYIRAVAWLLMVVVGLVLLLACTNLASFLLARARDRRREIAVRLALGASRGALVRQLLTETMLLSLLGGSRRLRAGGLAPRGARSRGLPAPLLARTDARLEPRPPSACVHPRYLGRGGIAARARAGPAERAIRRGLDAQARHRGRWATRSAPMAERARPHTAHGVARASRGRWALSAELSATERHRSGVWAGAHGTAERHGAQYAIHPRRRSSLRATAPRPVSGAARHADGWTDHQHAARHHVQRS